MNIHKNARLTPHSRAELVRRVLVEGQAPMAVATAMGVTTKTVGKWVARFAAEGAAGLVDRSSRPHRLYRPTPEATAERIEALRRQRWTGKHHHDVARSDSAALSHKLGLARVLEADGVELFLGYRPGDDRSGRAGASETDGKLQSVERAMGSGYTGVTGQVLFGRRNLDQGKGEIERGIGLTRVVHDFDRSIPNCRERSSVPDRDEWRQGELGAIVPAFGDDFRPNAGRITKRNRKRKIGERQHGCRS